ncbi:hypothetical protein LTR60_008022, partial [Cryomyces antarcticus]
DAHPGRLLQDEARTTLMTAPRATHLDMLPMSLVDDAKGGCHGGSVQLRLSLSLSLKHSKDLALPDLQPRELVRLERWPVRVFVGLGAGEDRARKEEREIADLLGTVY